MEDKFRQIVHFIKKNDNYIITSHINSDGDAIASTLAISYILEKWDKKYQIILHDQKVDEKYQYLWGVEKIKTYYDTMNSKFDSAIILDVPNVDRIGKPGKLLPKPENCLRIDHHPFEEDFTNFALVDSEASSTSQLVYELIKFSEIPLTKELAELIFSGIMYDTGRFSFSNTRKRDFEIAADLLNYHVSPSKVSNSLFFNNSLASMKTVGYGLANMESFLDGKLIIIFLPLEITQDNNHAEIEELANYSVSVRDAEVGLFIREIKKDYFKISFRSRGHVNVNVIAKVFNGGGHEHAAGARFLGNYKKLKGEIINEIKKRI